jgi:predicted amidohydrolase
MPTTMSEMLYLGMSFEDILLRVTGNPARIINRGSSHRMGWCPRSGIQQGVRRNYPTGLLDI